MTDTATQLHKPSSIEGIFEKVMYFIFLQLNSLKMLPKALSNQASLLANYITLEVFHTQFI